MDDFEWNVETEEHLLEALLDHKPVGVNKYFQMVFILEKLTETSNKEIQSEKIWEHLETMYNLESLDDNESLPFPNDETDFYLPEGEYGTLKIKQEEMQDDKKYSLSKGKETPKAILKEVLKKEEKIPIKKEEKITIKKEEKIPIKKEVQRRDSKDGKDIKSTPIPIKKEIKKEPEKKQPTKGRPSLSTLKEDIKIKKVERTPGRPPKRPTRGSIKTEDTGSTGKASPVTVPTNSVKRRRL